MGANTDYTIFAPTNAAFDKVPVDTLNGLLGDKEALRKVLLRHVIPGRKLEGKDVPTGSTKLKTASGEEVKADRGKFVQVSSSNKKAFVVKFDCCLQRGLPCDRPGPLGGPGPSRPGPLGRPGTLGRPGPLGGPGPDRPGPLGGTGS